MNEEKMIDYLEAGISQNQSNSGAWQMPKWVPSRVRMLKTVRPAPLIMLVDSDAKRTVAKAGAEYDVKCNKWGAVSAKIDGKLLGLHPSEFEILEWTDNPEWQANSEIS